MTRPRRNSAFCCAPHCPELVPVGARTSYCDAHRRAGWDKGPGRDPAKAAGWQIIRRQALARDGWCCVVCGGDAGDVELVDPRGSVHLGNAGTYCAAHRGGKR